MKPTIITILTVLFAPMVSYSIPQRPDGQIRQQVVVGIWHGTMDDLPAIDLEVKDDGGKLVGTVVFYRVSDEGSGPKVNGKSELSLIDPKFDGSTLIFSFKRKDGSTSKVQMKLVSDHEAVLKLLDDRSAEEGMAVRMLRDK